MKPPVPLLAALLFAASAASASADLAVERDARGTEWVCGADGGRIVGVGQVRVRQDGWNATRSVSQTAPGVVEVSVRAEGGGAVPNGWSLAMPLGEGAQKDRFAAKPGRWRRFCGASGGSGGADGAAAIPDAEPVEEPLGRWFPVRSPHGDVLVELVGNENWSGAGHAPLALEPEGGGAWGRTMRIVEMRDGETPGEAAARVAGLPFAISISTPARNNLFDGAGDVRVDFSVRETAGRAAADVPVALSVRDWDGAAVVSRTGRATFAAHGRRAGSLTLPALPRGLYFVELSVGEGAWEEFALTTVAVVPPFPFDPPHGFFFGICMRTGRRFADGAEDEYALAARLGFSRVRSGDAETARRHGMEAGFLAQMPAHDFDPASPDDAATVGGWLDRIESTGVRVFEFGNEIGHFAGEAERHALYGRYCGWLDAIRDVRARRGLRFALLYGTSARRPELVRLIDGKWIFSRLDAFAVHPGRLNWTPDLVGKGWRYRGLVLGSKRLFAALGHGDKPIVLTEVYAKTRPNDPHSDSLRQSAESAVLNAVVAMADGMAGFCAYQLHEGTSYDEDGVNPGDVQYHYGILNRDGSLKPSALGYETAAEELSGARFVRELRLRGTELRGFGFETPGGPLAVLWDRAEGFDLRTQGPRRRAPGEPFFHFEPWLGNWRESREYALPLAPGAAAATARDCIGRAKTLQTGAGRAKIRLDGSPVFVRGIDLAFFDSPEPETTANFTEPAIPEDPAEAESRDDG